MNVASTPYEKEKVTRTVLLSGISKNGLHDGTVVDVLEGVLREQVVGSQRVADDVIAVEMCSVQGARKVAALPQTPNLPDTLQVRPQWASGYIRSGAFIALKEKEVKAEELIALDADGYAVPKDLPFFPQPLWLRKRAHARVKNLKRKREHDARTAEALRANPLQGFVHGGTVGVAGVPATMPVIDSIPEPQQDSKADKYKLDGPIDVQAEYDKLMAKEKKKKEKDKLDKEKKQMAAAAAAASAAAAAAEEEERETTTIDFPDIQKRKRRASEMDEKRPDNKDSKRTRVDKEEALREESREELKRQQDERQRQSDDLQRQNEERLAKITQQKKERAKKKEEERAKKDASKKAKAEEKKVRQKYLDFSRDIIGSHRRGRSSTSSGYSRDMEREYANHYAKHLPDSPAIVLDKMRSDYQYYCEILTALYVWLRAQNGADLRDPSAHLDFLLSILKFGGIFASELASELPVLLKDVLKDCPPKGLTYAPY